MRCGILLLQVEKLRSSSVSGLKPLNILTTCRTSEDPGHDPLPALPNPGNSGKTVQ
jgi:hypothetical protein